MVETAGNARKAADVFGDIVLYHKDVKQCPPGIPDSIKKEVN